MDSSLQSPQPSQTPIVPPSITPAEKHTRHGLPVLIIVIVLLAVGFFAYQKYFIARLQAPMSALEYEKYKSGIAKDVVPTTTPTEKQKTTLAPDVKPLLQSLPTEKEKAASASAVAPIFQQ